MTAVGAIPTRGVYQVDGWGWAKTPFTYVAATRQVGYSGTNTAEWRLFGIYYDDPRGVVKTDNRAAPVRAKDLREIRIGTYGGHYIQSVKTSNGTVDLLAWGVLQSGDWGSLSQRSGAAAMEAGFQPRFLNSVRPWFRGGFFYSSGDGNAKDGVHGTSLLSFPHLAPMLDFRSSTR